ncbi:hypothetical protein [Streptomyces sp. NPDC087212]|uniref:hypothetical protein n=1 Tax=Streptomyces sp. NPDC087212 TaxID=3365766 RepID=UPI003809C1F2
MGIRMLNRRPASQRPRLDAAPATSRRSAPVFATAASTARVPADLVTTLRRTAADLRRDVPRRLTAARADLAQPATWFLWATLLRGHLATAFTRIPRSIRRPRTLDVFVALPTDTARRKGSAAR